MRNGWVQKVLSACVVLIALALLFLGSHRYYQVYKDPTLEESKETLDDGSSLSLPSGMTALSKPETKAISDRELVENATFTGVTRTGDNLFFTYDPSKPRGKQACPT